MIKDADFVILFITQLAFHKLLWFSGDEDVLAELGFADKAGKKFIMDLLNGKKVNVLLAVNFDWIVFESAQAFRAVSPVFVP